MGAAVVALLWANSPFRHVYEALSEFMIPVGPESWHLHLTVAEWAQDGILVLFFFVVGLELKEEFVNGSLRDPKTAALPMLAAVFGMVGPATVFTLVAYLEGDVQALHGWAIPAATDIAFAVAILSIFGKGLPPAARTFLLTLAVMDDLLGILVIAIFYPQGQLNFIYLAITAIFIILFGLCAQKGYAKWWILLPLGVLAWYFMHASGIHATIAGVALGMTVPCHRARKEPVALTHKFVDKVNPISAGLAVPIFAFFAAGVNIIDTEGGALAMLTHKVALAVMLALPIGKCVGIFGSVWLLTKFTPLRLGHGINYADIFPISLVAGIGFTVALLIASLAYSGHAEYTEAARLGVVLGTAVSAVLGAVFLVLRVSTKYRGDKYSV